MKTISEEKLKKLLLYKEERDHYWAICDELYYKAFELLDLDNDHHGWLTDYFENDNCTLENMLLHLGIDKEK